MVKPGLGSPAEMQCGGHMFFAPVHDLHQLLPVIHFLKLHLLHRRSGDDKPIIVMALNLVKGHIKFVQMAGRNILRLVAADPDKGHIHLQRSIGKGTEKLKLRILF